MAPVAPHDGEAYDVSRNTPTLAAGEGPNAGGPRPLGAFVAAGGAGTTAPPPPFVVREQARDGNCLFRSFSDQLYGTPEHHSLVRDRCSKYIASERGYFQQFVAEPFDEFLSRIRREGEWGDDVEIEALSEIYDCRVEIYASYSHELMRTFHEACDAKRPQPVRLQYEGRSHYNSLARRGEVNFVPILRVPGQQHLQPGEIEDDAISRSRRRSEVGQSRRGAGEADLEQTDREVLDESIRLSRLEFEHRSAAEMDRTLQESRIEWEKAERKRVDEEVVTAILQQSALEEEQKQLQAALRESKEALVHGKFSSDYLLGGVIAPATEPPAAKDVPGASSSSGAEATRDSREFQYPESVYAVMSMGFPLEKCIQAYHLVGDNPEGILAYCCQTLGR